MSVCFSRLRSRRKVRFLKVRFLKACSKFFVKFLGWIVFWMSFFCCFLQFFKFMLRKKKSFLKKIVSIFVLSFDLLIIIVIQFCIAK